MSHPRTTKVALVAGLVGLWSVGACGSDDQAGRTDRTAPVQRPPAQEPTDAEEQVLQAGFDAFIAEMYACMEEHGYHPRTVEDPSIVFDGPGAVTKYDPGEEQDPGFGAAQATCTERARRLESAAMEAVGGG